MTDFFFSSPLSTWLSRMEALEIPDPADSDPVPPLTKTPRSVRRSNRRSYLKMTNLKGPGNRTEDPIDLDDLLEVPSPKKKPKRKMPTAPSSSQVIFLLVQNLPCLYELGL